MIRDYIGFYGSIFASINALEDAEDRRTLYEAVLEYSFSDKLPKLSGPLKALFLSYKENIDRMLVKQENGRKGGRPSLQKVQKNNLNETEMKPNHNLTVTETEPNRNLTVTEIVQEIELESKSVNNIYNNIMSLSVEDGKAQFFKDISERLRANLMYGVWKTKLDIFVNYLWEAISEHKVLTYSQIKYSCLDWFEISQNINYLSVRAILVAMQNEAEDPKYYALGVLAERVRCGWVPAPSNVLVQIEEGQEPSSIFIYQRKKNAEIAENELKHFLENQNNFLPEQIEDDNGKIIEFNKAKTHELEEKWKEILLKIKQKLIKSNISKLDYDLWFKDVEALQVDAGVLSLLARSEIAKQRLLKPHLTECTLQSIQEVLPDVTSYKIYSEGETKHAKTEEIEEQNSV